eukprot:1161401-Pelagomonas_calceolata.AAC.27
MKPCMCQHAPDVSVWDGFHDKSNTWNDVRTVLACSCFPICVGRDSFVQPWIDKPLCVTGCWSRSAMLWKTGLLTLSAHQGGK